MALTEPTWTMHCTRCGNDTVGFEEDVEARKVGCRICGMTLTMPYFSDQQMRFFLIFGIALVILILICIGIGLSG